MWWICPTRTRETYVTATLVKWLRQFWRLRRRWNYVHRRVPSRQKTDEKPGGKSWLYGRWSTVQWILQQLTNVLCHLLYHLLCHLLSHLLCHLLSGIFMEDRVIAKKIKSLSFLSPFAHFSAWFSRYRCLLFIHVPEKAPRTQPMNPKTTMTNFLPGDRATSYLYRLGWARLIQFHGWSLSGGRKMMVLCLITSSDSTQRAVLRNFAKLRIISSVSTNVCWENSCCIQIRQG